MALDGRLHRRGEDLRRSEIDAAVALLARGMRDNPLHVAAYGVDPERRQRSIERTFSMLFRVFGAQQPICALDEGTLVAVTGVAPAGTCQPAAIQTRRLRSLPNIIAIGPSAAARVGKWLAAWSEHDPDQSHSHLGPFAVGTHLQGLGIGSKIMGECCLRLDARGETGYLETDKWENVHFYERHGYTVIAQADVIGVPNWFMIRQPQRSFR
ncbi:MAG TPA: GNAT family N-acetyltransferase [Solirubrobacteraceae bacterium]|nr:GNAT family N-acetyltransferase [Solirubrobacteraceae bacterium]